MACFFLSASFIYRSQPSTVRLSYLLKERNLFLYARPLLKRFSNFICELLKGKRVVNDLEIARRERQLFAFVRPTFERFLHSFWDFLRYSDRTKVVAEVKNERDSVSSRRQYASELLVEHGR